MISGIVVSLVAPYLVTPDVLTGENQEPKVQEQSYQKIIVHN
jgi:hypothetical protein